MLSVFSVCVLALGLLFQSMRSDSSTEWYHTAPILPHCEEDELIIGVGDFNGEVWDSYECAHYSVTR